MDGLLDEFLAETAEMLGEISVRMGELAHCKSAGAAFTRILRFLHTVKGTCGFLGLDRLEALAHAGETLVERCRLEAPPPQAITLIAETMRRIDWLLRAIGKDGSEPDGRDDDLIFHLLAVAGRPWPARDGAPPEPDSTEANPAALESHPIDAETAPFSELVPIAGALASSCQQLHETALRLGRSQWAEPMVRLCAAAAELQQAIAWGRMRPIGLAWRSIPAIVRDLSQKLGKKIDLELTGAGVPVPARALGPLKQALVHLIRNCADHGLESANGRLAAGKREAGKITVSASAEAGHVVIDVSDDGRGLNAHEIGAAALDRGLVSAAQLAGMDARQIQQFIFDAGFSTASQVTNISGRGVGMDVVRSSVAEIGGRLAVSSKPGEGTTFRVRLPEVMRMPAQTHANTQPGSHTAASKKYRKRLAA